MDELLQKLFEADVLKEETKNELTEAFKTHLEEATKAAREEEAANVRVELTEQWIAERDALIEAIDSKVEMYLESEMEELKSDIESFRDLEAEKAEELVKAKEALSEEFKGELAQLVEKLNSFLEIRLAAEMEELKEDIQTARQNSFGRAVFEAFVKEYTDNYADEESAAGSLRETQERNKELESTLTETEAKLYELERKLKLDEVLSPLDGRPREVMAAILENVATDQLSAGYKTFISRVIRTTDEEINSEKEDEVLAENVSTDVETGVQTLNEEQLATVTGDADVEPEQLNEELQAQLEETRRLAGLK